MRRLLGSPLLKYNYLKDFKKPFIEIPSSTPPKYIYQIEYHPSAMPDLDMKFQDHKHFDDWLAIVYGEEDKYEFQYKYSGQWWEAVSVTGRLIILGFAIGIWVSLETSAEERKLKHLPGIASFYRVEDVAALHIPTILEH